MNWLISLIASPIFDKLFGSLVTAYKAKLDSKNTTEAKAVELAVEEIKGEIALRQANKEVIIS